MFVSSFLSTDETTHLRLNPLHRNERQVFHQSHSLLNKWFGVSYSTQHSVKAGHGLNPRPDFIPSGEDALACFLIAELGLVSHQCLKASFELFRDIDHERRPPVVVERGVNDLEGPVRTQSRSAGTLPGALRASRTQ